MAFSKLVPHALTPTDAARQAVEAGVPYIKLCSGTLGSAAEYLAINPRLVIIGRHITKKTFDVYLAAANGSPQIAARLFLLDQLPIYGLNPDIKIWEGLNEESFGGPDEAGAIERMRKYAIFEAERVHILDGLGYGAVIGNFSVGYPEINSLDTRMWDAFLDPIHLIKSLNVRDTNQGKPERFFLGLHEYASPWMWFWAGGFQTGDCLSPSKWQFPGGSLGDKGWLTLRYRQVYTYILQPRNLVVPLLLTEIGNDRAGGGCPGMPIGAWRVLAEWWKNWNGQSDPIDYWRGTERDPETYYLNQLIWYDNELQKDAYVKAATIFTFGTDNPVWNDFRVDNAPKFMEGYLAYLAAGEVSMPITRTLNVADVAFWEIIRNSDQGTHDPKDDHRSTIFALLKEQGAQVNIGIGLVDIVFPNRLSFDRYDPVIYRDSRGPGLKDAGISIAMGMLDTLPSHMNVNGRIDRRFEAELRTAIRGIVTHFKDVIHRWAVGNELVGWTLDDYVWFLDVVTDTILSADGTARVAAALPLSQYGSTDHTTPFAQGILSKSQGKFHSWSIHPYSDDNNEIDLNRGMVQWFLTNDSRTLWITEWGKSKDKLVPHWNTDPAKLLQAETLQRDRFVSGYTYLASIPRVELISYHRLLDVPQASYGMVSQGVWDGEGYHKFLIFNAAKDLYTGVIPPIEPPIEEPAMPNTIVNPLFLEKDANGLSLVVTPPWPNMSGRILKPWRVLRVADRNTPKLNVNGTPGVDGVQDMDWQFGEYIDISAGQAPDILPVPKGRMYKMFRGPHWGSIGQDVTFTLAGTYRLATTVWPDSVLFYNPKTYSHPEPGHDDWHLGFEFRQGVHGITPADAPFLTLKDLPPGKWSTPTVDVVIPNAGVHTVFFEMRCRWALANAGGFVQEVSLTPVSVTPPDPEPTPVLPPIGTNYTGPEQNSVLDALRQKVGV